MSVREHWLLRKRRLKSEDGSERVIVVPITLAGGSHDQAQLNPGRHYHRRRKCGSRADRQTGKGLRSTTSGRAPATKANVALTLSDLQPDTLIAAANAPAAPAFAEGTWINSDPLTLETLRGRVMLVEFWTFGCDNCLNTLPTVKDWDTRYRDPGLTIVGVHSPELQSEYLIDSVRRQVPALGIKYPVVTDNDHHTWNAYGVEAWPTILVVDKRGRIRWLHVGEGRYDETESVIKTLLAE